MLFIADMVHEIVVFDDASRRAVASQLAGRVPRELLCALKVVRVEENTGQQVARNQIVRSARTDFVLLLDDDACLLDARSVKRALQMLVDDSRLGAVAFAQANADAEPWPESMQPATAKYVCFVPAFIGFAHLVRRSVFVDLGGYRGSFYYHGEEKEYCLRLLDAGYHVVYIPDAKVAHLPDATGRSSTLYLRYVVRNDCLGALYNDPWWRLLWTLPGRLLRYFKMRRGCRIDDPGGFAWLLRELVGQLPMVWQERRPLRAGTFRRWKELRGSPPYPASP